MRFSEYKALYKVSEELISHETPQEPPDDKPKEEKANRGIFSIYKSTFVDRPRSLIVVCISIILSVIVASYLLMILANSKL